MHEFVRQYLAYNTKEIDQQRSVVRLHPAGCDHGRGVVHGGQLRVPPVPRQHDRHQVGARVTCLSITRVTRVQVRDQPRRVRGRDRPHLLRARAVLGGKCPGNVSQCDTCDTCAGERVPGGGGVPAAVLGHAGHAAGRGVPAGAGRPPARHRPLQHHAQEVDQSFVMLYYLCIYY